jgi:hypothetical protein
MAVRGSVGRKGLLLRSISVLMCRFLVEPVVGRFVGPIDWEVYGFPVPRVLLGSFLSRTWFPSVLFCPLVGDTGVIWYQKGFVPTFLTGGAFMRKAHYSTCLGYVLDYTF